MSSFCGTVERHTWFVSYSIIINLTFTTTTQHVYIHPLLHSDENLIDLFCVQSFRLVSLFSFLIMMKLKWEQGIMEIKTMFEQHVVHDLHYPQLVNSKSSSICIFTHLMQFICRFVYKYSWGICVNFAMMNELIRNSAFIKWAECQYG